MPPSLATGNRVHTYVLLRLAYRRGSVKATCGNVTARFAKWKRVAGAIVLRRPIG